jgi:MinD superfamily P-loop ATPase
MKELTVISGKGGTGKTSLVASFAALAENKVVADCDVDAADLHLILAPEVEVADDFRGGRIAQIDPDKCTQCGECLDRCQFDAISSDFVVDKIDCEGCGVCVYFCPEDAIRFPRSICGKWFISRTRFGPMVHAELGIAQENSGLLVSLVRNKAKELAKEQGRDLILVDGSPGIGCPVIASITGTDVVLVVTEPTLSGLHDLVRIGELTAHFKIPTLVCINKYDLNEEMSEKIAGHCRAHSIDLVGHIPYSKSVTHAMVAGKSIVEFAEDETAAAIRKLWHELEGYCEA